MVTEKDPALPSTSTAGMAGDNDLDEDDENVKHPFNSPKKEYYSFVNPGMSMCLEELSCGGKSRENLLSHEQNVDRDLYQMLPATAIKDEIVDPGRRAIKNLIVLSCAFMCVFTAFVSMQSLHSSLNARGGLGVASLSCIYGATVLSSFVAPPVIHRLTTKWTVAAGFLLFVIYFTINFFPHGLMLIPASLLLGFLTGPLWSAQGTYLTTLAIRYAQSTQQLHEPVITKFNGIFTSIFQSSQILGHLISIIVLSFNPNKPPEYRYNFQYTHIDRYVAINKTWHSYNLNCGSHGCGIQEFPNDDVVVHDDSTVPSNIRNLLLGIHVGFSVLGLTLTVTLLDRGEVMVTEGKHPLSTSSHQLFLATLHMFQDPRLQLLLPLVLFIGLDQGFVFGDFTKAYVNCTLGVHKIGSVMICYGVVTAVSAMCLGYIGKHIKRFPIMTAGTMFQAGLFIVLMWWRPRHDDATMFYVIAGCLGLCDAIWQTQTNTLFGVLFAEKQEAAFSCYRMVQAIGLALAFGYSYVLCIETKLYIMGSFLLVGLLLYGVIEYRLHLTRKQIEATVVL